jgi:hypothetical protein
MYVSLVASCSVSGDVLSPSEDIGEDGNKTEQSDEGFGAIIFCEDVTEDGKIIGASNTFPVGTDQVWAYFNFWGMEKGQSWGRVWTHNGQEFINATDEKWEDLEEGWVAYSIGGSYDLEPGEYELTLLIGDRPVQRSSFLIPEE